MFLVTICLFLLGKSYIFVKGDYYSEYECNTPLVERASIDATSYMSERGPKNAILYGKNAWTAQANDFDQYLIFDLGQVMNVTRIWTKGRSFSSEYVMEYQISYGTNGLDYTYYKDSEGDIRMFKGNTDSDTVHKNEFEVPIIAQWIRINPTRWRDRISMRVELFGCEYVSKSMYFNGSSLLKLDLLRDPISALRETIKFRFKTFSANGVLLYSRGTQGDYIALQLRENRMLLNIDLGSNMVTSVSVGSLLDDNIWHDVVISRNRRDILFSVDRVIVQEKIKGDFNRLNLNRDFYIGGVSNIQEGLVVVQNYTGCIENLYLNSSNVIQEVREAYDYSPDPYKYHKINTLDNCPEPQIVPVTFTKPQSYAKLKGYEGMSSINVSFYFRTYENNGLMMYHSFSSSGFVAIFLEQGKLKVQLVTADTPRGIFDNYQETFNDGRWHIVVLSIRTNELVFSVDYRPMKTTRLLKIQSGVDYLFAGGLSPQLGYSNTVFQGFVGCMKTISIDGNTKLPRDWKKDEEYFGTEHVIIDACRMTDWCYPNPCQHNGICKQNTVEFICDCKGTGYGGAVCHTSINPLSCQAYKNVQHVGQKAEIKIDVDGSGPLAPFPVTCQYGSDGVVSTILHHSNEATTSVDGFQEPGSFVQDIQYEADDDQIAAFINRSSSCTQHIHYACKQARLFNSPSEEHNFQPSSWWVSRKNQKMDYWGGGLPGSRKCECGVMGTCNDRTKWCNCDGDAPYWLVDAGDLSEKDDLPVKQLRLGDTGSALDEREARYTLGPLICQGDDLFDNVVTFRISDATIDIPNFDMGHNGDIYFEFKTATENAVLFHAKGPTDYIKLTIVNGNQLQFQYQAGSGPITVIADVIYKLTDNNWHTVSVERNRKEAMVVVDGSQKAQIREPPGPVRAIHLTSALVIGASTDYRDGYTGCMRALLINGKHVDLREYARRGLYGISEGCVGRCDSSPCLNNGTCHEKYDSYVCDCRWTAFKGPICADEIGVNMKSNSAVKYTFDGSWRSTISEHIRVGFTTTNPKGFLLGFFSSISKEYLTMMVSNSGHLRIVFDFGFERQEVIYPDKHFGLGQYHDVILSRKNGGSTLVIKVDNYEPKDFHFNIKESADAQFNNIQYMYIGKNESMSEGFIGCVSRVEFDDIYPLKLLFQQSGPGNVKVLGDPLNEDFCGVEPITHPPDLVETRPPPIYDEEKVRRAYNQTDSAILGSILAVVFLILVALFILIGRWIHRHKGEYITQEDAGADVAADPDEAVVQGTTGHHVQKKKEWFI
ncbi:neurexin-4 isoform X2 [Anthonomus grandis grandis]|uniref:neurexin-4 isoform X2 n=1 Tax=Anthonomus grandis grandis TaxID=2921223 RepID=UPI002165A5AD|nr:neurexin-4 isoform X2 [Anthonomus grandis grandis]